MLLASTRVAEDAEPARPPRRPPAAGRRRRDSPGAAGRRDPGRPARPRAVRRPHRPGRPERRRRPARPGQGAAPQGRRRPRHRRPAGPHPRQPRAAAADLRDQALRHRGRPRRGAARAPCSRSATSSARCPARRPSEPVFGLEAKWIPAELRSQAELSGATVVDRASVITTHLAEVVRTHAARLLGREDVKTAHRRRQAHPPGRGRGAHPGPAQPRRGAAGAAGAARRAASRSATWSASSRRCRCAPQATKDPDAPRRGRPRGARPGHRRAVPQSTATVHVHQPRAAARAADARGDAPDRRRAASSPSTPSTGQVVLTAARRAR